VSIIWFSKHKYICFCSFKQAVNDFLVNGPCTVTVIKCFFVKLIVHEQLSMYNSFNKKACGHSFTKKIILNLYLLCPIFCTAGTVHSTAGRVLCTAGREDCSISTKGTCSSTEDCSSSTEGCPSSTEGCLSSEEGCPSIVQLQIYLPFCLVPFYLTPFSSVPIRLTPFCPVPFRQDHVV